ncbi:PREDICTED: protein eva-1 homolog A, partial [Tinamus guttatus]
MCTVPWGRWCVPDGPSEAVPKKLLHETQPRPTNYRGFQKPHFPLRPRAFDPNVIGDGVFLSDVSPSNIGRALPAEKKKGRSASFYPPELTPSLLPVDETQPPALNGSMEPVGVSTEMALLSNILAAYSFITENPERAALYFVSGVCIGLVLTLLALVLRVSCRTDCKRSPAKKPPRERESDSDSSDSDDDSDTTSDLSARRHRRFERTLNMNVFTSAEELERAQRLEERERIIREIWMNGQPDIPTRDTERREERSSAWVSPPFLSGALRSAVWMDSNKAFSFSSSLTLLSLLFAETLWLQQRWSPALFLGVKDVMVTILAHKAGGRAVKYSEVYVNDVYSGFVRQLAGNK